MIAWRIYYDDGSSFDSAQGGPGDAPAVGVIAILQRTGCDHHPIENFKTGEGRLSGENFYWWRADLNCWLQGDREGLMDQMTNCAAQFVKLGRMTSHRNWEKQWTALASDRDFH